MWRELFGLNKGPDALLELITPRRTFRDVVLPDRTRQQLYEALTQIDKDRLIFHDWGLGERHPEGRGLVFNFAGPPGTGKTICAEAIASTLGRKLLRVRYSELESCWVGETGKNIRTVFREARAQDAVLFFDEADSIAARRFTHAAAGHEREANLAVNILLKELEEFRGVVIFATNLAASFDPAFERRVRTHILFELPGEKERERIWRVQFHPQKTPLGSDVDLAELARRFPVSGGDIRNAVLKAAQIAAAGEGPDETKRILQPHLVAGMEQVLAGKVTMQQSALGPDQPWPFGGTPLDELESGLDACRTELAVLAEAHDGLETRLADRLGSLEASLAGLRDETAERALALRETESAREAAMAGLLARLEAQERRLAGATLFPWGRRAVLAAGSLLALTLFLAGLLVGRIPAW